MKSAKQVFPTRLRWVLSRENRDGWVANISQGLAKFILVEYAEQVDASQAFKVVALQFHVLVLEGWGSISTIIVFVVLCERVWSKLLYFSLTTRRSWSVRSLDPTEITLTPGFDMLPVTYLVMRSMFPPG